MTISEVPRVPPRGNGALSGVSEIFTSLGRFTMWGPLALDDVISSYRRTIFGPLWLIASQAAFIFGIYFLHQASFGGTARQYLAYLAISMPTWAMLVTFIVDGSTSMVTAKGLMESYPLPPAIHVIRPVARAFVTFAHLLPVYAAVELWVDHRLPVTIFAAIPALALIAVFGIGAGLGLAPLGARYRDIPPALQSMTMLTFVLTPVFWVASATDKLNPMVKFNPLYYLLETVREPFLGSWGEPHVWATAAAIAFGTLIVGVLVYSWRRSTVIYWL